LLRLFQLRGSAQLLAVARIVIGLCSFAVGWEVWRILSRLVNPLVVQLPYFTWLPRLPLSGLPAFIVVWFLASTAFVVGFKTRLAGATITCLSAYVLLFDQQTYSNHLYLFFLIVLLLTVADSGAALSLDARRRGQRDYVAGWPIRLLKLQVSLVYGFSAVAKLTPQFLSGDVLSQTLKQHGWLTFPQSLRNPQLLTALALTAIVVELFIAFGLWSKSLRLAAVVAGVTLHAFILTMLDSSRLSLGIFALEMFALYPLFFQRLGALSQLQTNTPGTLLIPGE
jgi:hypothetical protein